jgi:predicted GNAT family acetyltransferase
VLADARSTGVRVSPLCPLFVAHFERHPKDADLLAVGRGHRPAVGRESG